MEHYHVLTAVQGLDVVFFQDELLYKVEMGQALPDLMKFILSQVDNPEIRIAIEVNNYLDLVILQVQNLQSTPFKTELSHLIVVKIEIPKLRQVLNQLCLFYAVIGQVQLYQFLAEVDLI